MLTGPLHPYIRLADAANLVGLDKSALRKRYKRLPSEPQFVVASRHAHLPAAILCDLFPDAPRPLDSSVSLWVVEHADDDPEVRELTADERHALHTPSVPHAQDAPYDAPVATGPQPQEEGDTHTDPAVVAHPQPDEEVALLEPTSHDDVDPHDDEVELQEDELDPATLDDHGDAYAELEVDYAPDIEHVEFEDEDEDSRGPVADGDLDVPEEVDVEAMPDAAYEDETLSITTISVTRPLYLPEFDDEDQDEDEASADAAPLDATAPIAVVAAPRTAEAATIERIFRQHVPDTAELASYLEYLNRPQRSWLARWLRGKEQAPPAWWKR